MRPVTFGTSTVAVAASPVLTGGSVPTGVAFGGSGDGVESPFPDTAGGGGGAVSGQNQYPAPPSTQATTPATTAICQAGRFSRGELIERATPLLDDLRRSGFWLDEATYQRARELALEP